MTEDLDTVEPNLEDEINADDEAREDEEDEEELTAQSALLAIEQAWLNEKFAPEILPHQSDLVDCMLQQITHMEENINRLAKSDLRVMIHRMELDRIRFVISSYLRTRLEKIERYTIHILSQEAERTGDDCYLTPAELQFAKDFLSSVETLFGAVATQHMPGNFQTFDITKCSVKPNLQAYVFLRANTDVSGVMLPGETDETIDFTAGSQHIIRYGAVAEMVKNGTVQLI